MNEDFRNFLATVVILGLLLILGISNPTFRGTILSSTPNPTPTVSVPTPFSTCQVENPQADETLTQRYICALCGKHILGTVNMRDHLEKEHKEFLIGTHTYQDKWYEYRKDLNDRIKESASSKPFLDAMMHAVSVLHEKNKAEEVINNKILAHKKPTEADFDRYFTLKKKYKEALEKEERTPP